MDARFYNPITFAAFLLGFKPDPVQSLILLSTALRGVLNCTRQWGKSSIMAVKALWEAMTVHGTTVLILCPTFKQAGEFFQKIRDFCWKLGIDPVTDGHNRFSVKLPNRSRIIGVSGLGHLRSYGGVSLLLVDEAAEVDETAYHTSRAFVATVGEFGGRIWLMSTPQGRDNFFYRAWQNETGEWERFSVKATDCPRISRYFLAQERAEIGQRMFAQEYMCEFIDPPDCLFNIEDIRRAISPNVPVLRL